MNFIRQYAKFVLDHLVKLAVQRKCRIVIKVMHQDQFEDSDDTVDLKRYRAWCTYDGVFEDKRVFTIVVNIKQVNKKAKKPEIKFKNLFVDLGHELVHVKQYLNNELRDYCDGSYKFLGRKYRPILEDKDGMEEYFNSPIEIEAYGREYGLYKMFVYNLKKQRILNN